MAKRRAESAGRGGNPKHSRPAKVGVISGLLVELACLREAAADGLTFAAAGDAGRATAAAERMIVNEGASALLSFGIAGGLDPGLKPGDAIVPVTVFAPGGHGYHCHMPLVEALRGVVPGAAGGALFGSDTVVRTPREKRRLRDLTGAGAVDMESHAVALAAEEYGVPFAALRVISDPARGVVPSAALAAMQPDGSLDSRAVARRLWRRPWELPAIIALARHNRAAFRRLREIGAADPVAAARNRLAAG